MLVAVPSSFFISIRFMAKKKITQLRYRIGDLIGNSFLVFLIFIFRKFSLKTVAPISKVMGDCTFYLFKRFRERVIENLSLAFGNEMDENQIRELARAVFFHFTLTPLETIHLIANAFNLKQFFENTKIEGKEHLDAALAKGKGVIALGGHLGSFTFLTSKLAVEGYPVNIIINMGNFPRLWKTVEFYHVLSGQKMFFSNRTTHSIKKSLNCLHRNEILYLIADEQQRRGGIPVPFFGQTAFTPPGPAIFSIKTGAPILPMFVLRTNGDQRTLIIGRPLEFERTSNEEEDVKRLTAAFTKAIEDVIRQYPDQWAWLNRRWKLPTQRLTAK
jgi:Kdo2-lipid IVA lauroyltransferase/acyltransferase